MTLGAVTDADGSTITTITRLDQYLHAMYWAMTTMTTVGYGDISASVRDLSHRRHFPLERFAVACSV